VNHHEIRIQGRPLALTDGTRLTAAVSDAALAGIVMAAILGSFFWLCIPSEAENAKRRAAAEAVMEALHAQGGAVDDCVARGFTRH